jgi:hypothetical protein
MRGYFGLEFGAIRFTCDFLVKFSLKNAKSDFQDTKNLLMKPSCYIFFWIMCVAFLLSCSERERNNPLDPQNPKTKGRLVGLKAVAKEKAVSLSWDAVSLGGIDHVNIYRKTAADSEFVLFYKIPPTAHSYMDSVTYGLVYQYRISATIDDYETPFSLAVTVEPGPTYTWVADLSEGVFARLSHDLQTHLFDYYTDNFPIFVVVDPAQRAAWGYTRYANELLKIDETGSELVRLRYFPIIDDMDADTLLHKLWFVQSDSGKIVRLDEDGNQELETNILQSPTAIAVNSLDHDIWVADEDTGRLYHLSYRGTEISQSSISFNGPVDIAINVNSSSVWVADGGKVVQMDYSNQSMNQITGFYNAVHVQVDNRRDVVWVADLEPSGEPASLIKLGGDGQLLFELNIFGNIRDIAVNEYDGSCLVADSGANHAGLYKVSSDGQTTTKVNGVFVPYAVAVECH